MNKDQAEARSTEAKGKIKKVAGKVTRNESTEHQEHSRQRGGKAGAVLGDINSGARKSTR